MRVKVIGIAAAILVVVYGVFGFFFLPGIVKPRIIRAVTDYTHCPVNIGDVSTNPFALSATIRDFALLDKSKDTIFAFHKFYINFELSSIFHRAYTFSEFRLDAPSLAVKVRPGGAVNLQDMLPQAEQPPDTSHARPIPVIIQDLVIDSGRVAFEDRNRPVVFQTMFDSLGLTLRDFSTLPSVKGEYHFEASTTRNEVIRWKGTIGVVPLQSAGTLELVNVRARSVWDYIRDKVNFEALSGFADIRGEYMLNISGPNASAQFHDGSLGIHDLTLLSEFDSVKAVTVPVFLMSGVSLKYPERKIDIGSIRAERAQFEGSKYADGRMTLKNMFLPKSTQADTSHMGWEILLSKMELADGSLRILDKTTNPPAEIALAPSHLLVEGLRLDKPLPAKVSMSTTVNGSGTASVAGTMTLDMDKVTVEAKLKTQLSKVALTPFQPYVNSYAKVELKSGTLSFDGSTHYILRSGRQTIDYDGEAAMETVRATDALRKQDFLRWKRLQLRQFSYKEGVPSLSIKEIVADEPYLRLIIGPDRVTNLQHMMVSDSTGDSTSRMRPAVLHDTTKAAAKPTQSKIGQVTVRNGSLNFSDFSLTPNFVLGIEELNGAIKGLSSEQLTRADVDLQGKVDKYAPAVVSGQINPLSEEAFTDIGMHFEGIELTTFSPYFGKFAGYKIDKGKLNLDLRYKLNKHLLEGENKIVLDQLTLGEKVESPDATSLPIRLAIALLKDSHGVIDLDIPVSGDLNDPDFSLMPIVWKAVWHLVVKVVTSPFALLGSLFGGGEELSYVTFHAGSDSVAFADQGKLASLAKALTERPELALDVRGVAVPSLDHDAIAERIIMSKLRSGGSAPASIDQLTQEQQANLLGQYKDMFKDDPENLVPPASQGGKDVPEAERQAAILRAAHGKLVAAYPVTDDMLRGLARRRADKIKSYLVLKNGIPEARVFVREVDTGAAAKEGDVRMELALEAR